VERKEKKKVYKVQLLGPKLVATTKITNQDLTNLKRNRNHHGHWEPQKALNLPVVSELPDLCLSVLFSLIRVVGKGKSIH